MTRRPPSVSVVVTTFGRPALLRRCLDGIAAQSPQPDEVVAVHRPSDRETVAVLERWSAEDPERRRRVTVQAPGIVPALDAGTAAAAGEVVVFIDDDAAPRAGWLAALLQCFSDPAVAGAGGPIVDHVDGRVERRWTDRIGQITWYGRVIGRHDHETAYAGDVDWVTGGNMAFRRGLVRHDPRLMHSANGLALANELDSCLNIRRQGGRLVFAPNAVVDHITTSRRDPVLGSRVEGRDVRASAANTTYALLKFLPPMRRPAFLLYALLVGTSTVPGPVRPVLELPRNPRRAAAIARRIPMAWLGRLSGVRMYRAWRRDEPAATRSPRVAPRRWRPGALPRRRRPTAPR
jgi:GT2 family glycosyltransferase